MYFAIIGIEPDDDIDGFSLSPPMYRGGGNVSLLIGEDEGFSGGCWSISDELTLTDWWNLLASGRLELDGTEPGSVNSARIYCSTQSWKQSPEAGQGQQS